MQRQKWLLFGFLLPIILTVAHVRASELPVTHLTADQHERQTVAYQRLSPEQFASKQTLVTAKASDNQRYYFGFTLKNDSGSPQWLALDVGRWGQITALVQRGNRWQQLQSGGELPMSQRSFAHYYPLIALSLAAGEQAEVLVAAGGKFSYFVPQQPQISLLTRAAFHAEQQQRWISQGIFFGVILVMAIYNFLIYTIVRDISYLWFVLSLIGVGVYFAFFYGFTIEFIWQESPLWDLHSFAFVLSFTGLARLLFTQSYLHTAEELPLINRLLYLLAALYLIPLTLATVSLSGGSDWVAELIQIIGLLGTAVLLMMLLAGIAGYRKGYKPALFFIIANALFIVGAILFIFRETGWWSDNFFTRYVAQIGIIAQVIIFSLGLAYRLNRAQLELANEKLAKERLAAEQAREKSALIARQKQALEREVAERTADLRQKTADLEEALQRISDSEHHLRELNRVKDKLFSIISHDLRSPVVTLDSFLNLISRHAERLSPEEMRKLSVKTRQALSNLSFLLENLLHWSKTQMAHYAVQRERLDIGDLIEKNLLLFDYRFEEKNIDLYRRMVQPSEAAADRAMTDIVLRNLISNALKFTPEGGAITVETFLNTENQLVIRISDTGKGFSDAQLRSVLQGNKPEPERGTAGEKGTGLGLMLAREFVAANGGSISFSNLPKGGAMVEVRLPYEP
ncbi:sensor histidine kinase [Rhodoflexus caldus]|uniref:sensor histidine kinase n=1 Tax=Rhodoflexus caldus TaxID=2891236 RepID=UPI00202A01BE|nr:sensor histidine kinase [Rhodoflexus caldus]